MSRQKFSSHGNIAACEEFQYEEHLPIILHSICLVHFDASKTVLVAFQRYPICTMSCWTVKMTLSKKETFCTRTTAKHTWLDDNAPRDGTLSCMTGAMATGLVLRDEVVVGVDVRSEASPRPVTALRWLRQVQAPLPREARCNKHECTIFVHCTSVNGCVCCAFDS